MEALKSRAAPAVDPFDKTSVTEATEGESGYLAGNVTTNVSAQSKSGAVPKKKGAKPKLTAKEKKERSVRTRFSIILNFTHNKSHSLLFL